MTVISWLVSSIQPWQQAMSREKLSILPESVFLLPAKFTCSRRKAAASTEIRTHKYWRMFSGLVYSTPIQRHEIMKSGQVHFGECFPDWHIWFQHSATNLGKCVWIIVSLGSVLFRLEMANVTVLLELKSQSLCVVRAGWQRLWVDAIIMGKCGYELHFNDGLDRTTSWRHYVASTCRRTMEEFRV